MNLPPLRYHCVHCGYSCQDLEVEISSAEYGALKKLYEPPPVELKGARTWLKKNCQGCELLAHDGSSGRCTLHRDHGVMAKPRACREFPFRAVQTPGGAYVGASFACRAIATGQGPPVSLGSFEARPLAFAETPMSPGVAFDWERYQRWESRVRDLLREKAEIGLWSAALEIGSELASARPGPPTQAMEQGLWSLFRGLLALAEGFREEAVLLEFLQAHQHKGRYWSRLAEKEIDVASITARWEEPWSLWPRFSGFVEHLLFRKFLLEGPDVYSRICSLPVFVQLLQFLVLSRAEATPDEEDMLWGLRLLEERLTFHSRGLERYLGRFGALFLEGLEPRNS